MSELFQLSLQENELYDVLIVGGGPAAISAGLYAARKGLKTGLITYDMGGQVLTTATVENYPGNTEITGVQMMDEWRTHMLHYPVAFHEFVHAERIAKIGNEIHVTTDDKKTFKGKTAIVATGKRSRPLGVAREDELTGRGVAYCATCDAPLYRGKTVAVVGGGNSAVEAIVDLGKIAEKIYVFQFLEDYTADPIVIEKIAPYKDKVEAYFNTAVHELIGENRLEQVVIRDRINGTPKTITLDGLFVEIGLIPNTEIVKNLLALNAAGEIKIDAHCKTSVEGIFAAGDVTDVPYKQIVISAGEGAKAALAAYDYLLTH